MPEVKKKKSMENAVRFFCRLSYRSLCCLISINEVVLEVFSVFSFILFMCSMSDSCKVL